MLNTIKSTFLLTTPPPSIMHFQFMYIVHMCTVHHHLPSPRQAVLTTMVADYDCRLWFFNVYFFSRCQTMKKYRINLAVVVGELKLVIWRLMRGQCRFQPWLLDEARIQKLYHPHMPCMCGVKHPCIAQQFYIHITNSSLIVCALNLEGKKFKQAHRHNLERQILNTLTRQDLDVTI